MSWMDPCKMVVWDFLCRVEFYMLTLHMQWWYVMIGSEGF